MNNLPIYITGNAHKAEYLSRLLGLPIQHRNINLDEIQSVKPEEVVEHKVRQAYELTNSPVLVEDTCMGLDDLGGLPGPFIKFLIEQDNGAEKICRMADGLPSRRATVIVTFGYYDGTQVTFFQGVMHGEIAQHPGKPTNGYGWDTTFIPDGYNGIIRSELPADEYDELYLKVKPIAEVREFLQNLVV